MPNFLFSDVQIQLLNEVFEKIHIRLLSKRKKLQNLLISKLNKLITGSTAEDTKEIREKSPTFRFPIFTNLRIKGKAWKNL